MREWNTITSNNQLDKPSDLLSAKELGKAFGEAMLIFDPRLPRARRRGDPLSLVLEALHSGGWKARSATKFTTRDGSEVPLEQATPAVVLKLLADGIVKVKSNVAWMKESIGQRHLDSVKEILADGVWTHPIRSLLKGKGAKRLSPKQKRRLRQAWCGWVTTNDLLHRWGTR